MSLFVCLRLLKDSTLNYICANVQESTIIMYFFSWPRSLNAHVHISVSEVINSCVHAEKRAPGESK